jgi:hypothetical protein
MNRDHGVHMIVKVILIFSIIIHKMAVSNIIHHFNVSGVHVDISAEKLAPHRNCLLLTMVNNSSQPNEILFVDCSPKIFEHILQFINHGIKINTILVSRALNISVSDLIDVVKSFRFENIFFLNIWKACYYNYLPLVKYYLETDLDVQDKDGNTPIMFLLNKNSLYSNGETKYDGSNHCVSDYYSCINEIFKLNAKIVPSINYRDKYGHTILDYLSHFNPEGYFIPIESKFWRQKFNLWRQKSGAVNGINKKDCTLKNPRCPLYCNNDGCTLL